MRGSMLGIVVIMSGILAACETEEREAHAPGEPDAAQELVASISDEETKVGFVDLGSGILGQATVQASGAQTRISVELTGARTSGMHRGHVHSGTCENIGQPIAELQPVTTATDGVGTVATTVDQRMEDLMDGRHVIVYHEAGGNPGRPVTCALLPREEG